jgi:hypothetical protein
MSKPIRHQSHDQLIQARYRGTFYAIQRPRVRCTFRVVPRPAKSIGQRPLDQNCGGSRHWVRHFRGDSADRLRGSLNRSSPPLPPLFPLLSKRDEILNGKTLDRNSHYFARYCFENGIALYVGCVCVAFMSLK